MLQSSYSTPPAPVSRAGGAPLPRQGGPAGPGKGPSGQGRVPEPQPRLDGVLCLGCSKGGPLPAPCTTPQPVVPHPPGGVCSQTRSSLACSGPMSLCWPPELTHPAPPPHPPSVAPSCALPPALPACVLVECPSSRGCPLSTSPHWFLLPNLKCPVKSSVAGWPQGTFLGAPHPWPPGYSACLWLPLAPGYPFTPLLGSLPSAPPTPATQ